MKFSKMVKTWKILIILFVWTSYYLFSSDFKLNYMEVILIWAFSLVKFKEKNQYNTKK